MSVPQWGGSPRLSVPRWGGAPSFVCTTAGRVPSFVCTTGPLRLSAPRQGGAPCLSAPQWRGPFVSAPRRGGAPSIVCATSRATPTNTCDPHLNTLGPHLNTCDPHLNTLGPPPQHVRSPPQHARSSQGPRFSFLQHGAGPVTSFYLGVAGPAPFASPRPGDTGYFVYVTLGPAFGSPWLDGAPALRLPQRDG